MNRNLHSGGDPELFAECSECGDVYPAQWEAPGEPRPIGVDGTCDCGNDEFVSISE